MTLSEPPSSARPVPPINADAALDEALEETFPASDPIAPGDDRDAAADRP